MEILLCSHCKNYVGDLSCFAFPERIPDEILEGKNNHSKPLPGQTSDEYIFEPKDPVKWAAIHSSLEEDFESEF
jgi:hypothetical protein